MRKVKAKELSLEEFKKYGTFSKMVDPVNISVGPAIHEFFCDQLVYNTASSSPVALSTSRVMKRPVVVETTEIHRQCGEVLLPLDGDVYIHVGQCSDIDSPPYDKFEIFRVRQGWAVCLRPGTWHFAAFPCEKDVVNVLVLLPERTYANDCVVKHIPPEQQITLD
jgi:ureidoglycolate lyase